ncbi:DUF6462 family protein [Butyrivibrio sp. AD3002]|uniref:DUF6462 family protein n=1 Tax=Butyrivibrio sp. AD3002 TaxID=1280670 RepID=UPI0003B52FF2|nr:DUF6462 family protein [Butyrivibrio sp. AD3002]
MGKDIATVRETKAKTTRLMKLNAASEMYDVDKRTLRKWAIACGAYYPTSKQTVYVDPELIDEYIRSMRPKY